MNNENFSRQMCCITAPACYTKSLNVLPMGPPARSDRHDEPRAFNQFVPVEAAMVEDVIVVGENPVGEPIVAHVLPDVLDGIEFRCTAVGISRGQRRFHAVTL